MKTLLCFLQAEIYVTSLHEVTCGYGPPPLKNYFFLGVGYFTQAIQCTLHVTNGQGTGKIC